MLLASGDIDYGGGLFHGQPPSLVTAVLVGGWVAVVALPAVAAALRFLTTWRRAVRWRRAAWSATAVGAFAGFFGYFLWQQRYGDVAMAYWLGGWTLVAVLLAGGLPAAVWADTRRRAGRRRAGWATVEVVAAVLAVAGAVGVVLLGVVLLWMAGAVGLDLINRWPPPDDRAGQKGRPLKAPVPTPQTDGGTPPSAR